MARRLVIVLIMVALTGCTWSSLAGWSLPGGSLQGDVERGREIFTHGINGSPPCLSCHGLTTGAFSLGPVMAGVGERAAGRTPDLAADDYLRQSILNPAAFIVPGYRDIMYARYADHFSDQEIADLLAFLHSL
jgi:cytochrome c2